MDLTRSAGILLHPTSLPGAGGIGTTGEEAIRFLDWLSEAGQSYWQMLPLVAVDEGGSPYNGLSAMAGNPLLVDAAGLAEIGLLDRSALPSAGAADRVDYRAVVRDRDRLLRSAYEAFRDGAAPELEAPFAEFRLRNREWLDDYTLFRALRDAHDGAAWTEWRPALRDRDPVEIGSARAELKEDVSRYAFAQFLFDRDWARVRKAAAVRGVRLIGDLPIFVAHDSADVWAHRELFQLDGDGRPTVVSGVPPDYFSETGQLWGNPLYDWDRMRELGYEWWVRRFRRTFEWVDLVRVDHFRGFQAYWEVPAGEETALNGRWCEGPGRALFDAVRERLGDLPIIAEDLGLITPEVEALRDDLDLPGMRVIQFAFDGDPSNPHLPENHPENAVAYTGTHDNDTAVGWWESAPPEERARARELIDGAGDEPHWDLIRLVLESPAVLAVIPAQDVLGLGSDARMNTPGTWQSNWSWRLMPGELTEKAGERLLEETRRTRRLHGRRR